MRRQGGTWVLIGHDRATHADRLNLLTQPSIVSAEPIPARLRIVSRAANDTTGGEPPMEARIARLEAHAKHIREDVSSIKVDIRILLGMIITGALGLAGLMAKGFNWF